MPTTLIFGSDHGGFKLKSFLTNAMKTVHGATDYKIIDMGCYTDEEKCDYPDYANLICKEVLSTPNSYGILICGTVCGISIAANKIDNIYCALCYDENAAKMAKRHNNANVIALGGRILQEEEALKIVTTFLTEDFEGGRHQKRLEKVKRLQNMFK